MDLSPWGAFALVCYVNGPLGLFLGELRTSLCSRQMAPAHITLLPPRALQEEVDIASGRVALLLEHFCAFDVELGSVKRFTSDVLYLDLVKGQDSVRHIHQALNIDGLADKEEFDFHPHLTLGGPFGEPEIDSAEEKARGAWRNLDLPRRFQVDELVGLWAEPNKETYGPWSRLFRYSLTQCRDVQPERKAIGQTS